MSVFKLQRIGIGATTGYGRWSKVLTAVSTSAPVVGPVEPGKLGLVAWVVGLAAYSILDAIGKYLVVNHTLFSYVCITLANTN